MFGSPGAFGELIIVIIIVIIIIIIIIIISYALRYRLEIEECAGEVSALVQNREQKGPLVRTKESHLIGAHQRTSAPRVEYAVAPCSRKLMHGMHLRMEVTFL